MSIVRSSIALIAVVAAALLALIPAAPGAGPVSASIIYIEVEPQGLGEVGYFPSPSGPASEWPRATTPIGSFFTMSFPQGTYMYLEARPYGCAELDRWEVTPEDVNWSYAGSRERIVVIMDKEYITVRAVFRQIPGECPYMPVWRSIRIRWSDLVAGATIFAVAGAVGGMAYAVKRGVEERRRREERARRRVEDVRRNLLDRLVDWNRPAMIAPWQVILFTCLKTPDLAGARDNQLREALMDDRILGRLRDIQASGLAGLGHCYIADALDGYTGNIPLLGLKTYLALYNLAPSTDEITRMYLASLDPDNLPMLWYEPEGVEELRKILELISENMGLQRRGLKNVLHLMETDPEYARRIREPHEYYATLLRFIQEWTAERLGITFTGIMLGAEAPIAPKIREEAAAEEASPVKAPIKKEEGIKRPIIGEARRPVEEAVERVTGEEVEGAAGYGRIELPDNVPMPRWLADAIDQLEKEREKRPVEEEIRGVEKAGGIEAKKADAVEEPERVIEARPREEVEAKPARAEAGLVKAKVPVSWDELPAPLQRQIEGLGLTFEEAVSIALKTMGKGEKDVYREVNRLLSEKYPDMGEQDLISTLMTAVNTIAWLQAILEEKKVGAVEPVEGVEAEVAEEGAEERAPEKLVEKAGIVEEAGGGRIYGDVEVDYVGRLSPPIQAAPGTLYLIDSPAQWIPTPLLVDLFKGPSSNMPVTLERRRHYGGGVVNELFSILRRICLVEGKIPIIIVGKPGYILVKGEDMWIVVKNIKYVEKLMELLRRLREAGVARFAVAMPFAVYKKYCRNMEELRMMRRHVYIVDVDVAARELSGRIPEGALPCLKLIASLSPSLLRELSRSPRHVTWRPAVAGGTGEGEALAWAVRMIISKGGPLTVDDVVRAGYRDYLDSLIVLGMVERG